MDKQLTVVLDGIAAWVLAMGMAYAAPADEARRILEESGTKGGLVVHVGCGDGKLTAALRANDSYVVQGLETDPIRVAEARKQIQASGVYGPVSVVLWDGKQLPYAENMVNLLVADSSACPSNANILRVLAPLGVAYVHRDGQWTKTVKPWPREMDQWTHWLHDAGNNAVAHDTQVGPPQRVQWVADPLWSRGHEIISSVGAVVTARGRLVYVLDEGQPGVYDLPSKWVLVARNAFNGVLLWKKPIPDWGPPVARGGHAGGFRPRRLVTDGDRLFLPMGEDAVLTSVDAASGKTLKTLEAASGTSEILCKDELLLAVVAARAKGPATLLAARPETLDVLWQIPVSGITPQTAALNAGRVYFCSGRALVALDASSGKEVWHTPPGKPSAADGLRISSVTLIASGSTVYLSSQSTLSAFSAESGKLLWQQGQVSKGRGQMFVARNRVWLVQGSSIVGYDTATGQERARIDASAVFSPGHHPRCYPGKATENYVITNNRGAEFISLTSQEQVQNDWLRGNCGHGVMPANGLLYAPPNQCFCYGGVMATGFKALAAGPVPPFSDPLEDGTRLERGPAYDLIPSPESPASPSDDWPMYRHDPARLGSTPTAVPSDVQTLWKVALGGRLTQPVAARGMLLVAASDAHTVHALDTKGGRRLWSYTAGGRIDSSPTMHEGLVLFGCTDGWAYCLRASDGQLVWRFRAAPVDRRVGAFGQVESAWPVHGSVVVLKGVAYLTAGRSTYLDGGILAYGLEPKSGRIVQYRRLQGAVTGSTEKQGELPYVPAFHIEGARSDLFVADGEYLYMGPLKLDARLVRQPTPYIAPHGKTASINLSGAPYVDPSVFAAGKKRNENNFTALGVLRGPMGDKNMGLRLLATGGFLDDSWYNRNYWMYARVWPGFYIANLAAKSGELLAVDQTTTYGVQGYPSRTIHSPSFSPGGKGYLLFADDNANEPVLDDQTRGRDKGMGYARSAPPKWFQWVRVLIRAMVKTDKTLFVAGPPDVFDENDPYAAYEGRKGAVLWAVDASNGRKLAEVPLDASPVFDGMIAAGGRLYVAGGDGTLSCLGKK